MSKPILAYRLGASMRDTVSTYYVGHGPDVGYACARRCAAESVAIVKEMHGRRAAYEMIAEIGDALVKDRLLDLDPGDLPPAIADDLAAKAEAKDPLIMVPGPGGNPIMYENMTLAEAATAVEAAHKALQAAIRLEAVKETRPSLRWIHKVPGIPLWFVTFIFGLFVGTL